MNKYGVIQGENGMYKLLMLKDDTVLCESFSEKDLRVAMRILNEASRLPALNWKGEIE